MHPHLINRFNRAFNTSGVQMIRERKKTSEGVERTVNFVSINSMALERDGCSLCNEAEFNIKSVEKKLNQLKNKDKYSQPIVLQHFPTFRASDEDCLEKTSVNLDKYREKYDTISKESTNFIHRSLSPRVYFSGHSHHHCRLKNSVGIEEFTVASFNWRNLNNPSFLLAIFTPDDYSVSKCDLPQESTVIAIYILGVILTIVFALKDFNFSRNFVKRIYFKIKPKSFKQLE